MEELEVLYNGLYEDGKYSKSFEEFKAKYNSDENIKFLYEGLVNDGDYSKSLDEFKGKYFSNLKKKENFELNSSQEETALESDGEEIIQPSSDIESTEEQQLLGSVDGSDEEMSQLYDKFKEAGIVSNESISEIKDQIAAEKEGDFGWMTGLKHSFMVKNPQLSDFFGLKWEQPTNEEEAKFKVSRNQQIEFLDELPDEKRKELLNYAVNRDTSLNRSSTNAMAFNEVLLGKYNTLMRELNDFEFSYKNAKEQGKEGDVTPEFFKAVNETMSKLNSVISEIESNNSIVENNADDISNFPQELDLLRRNYGNWHNFKEKTRLSAARLIFGGKQKIDNFKYDMLDPNRSDFGYAYSGLFREDDIEKDSATNERDRKEAEKLNKDALELIDDSFQDLQPNMQVGDIQNIGDFGQWASEQIAQQVPIITTMAMTGGTVGSGLIGVSSAGTREIELKAERDKGNNNYTDSEIFWASTGYGASEFIFERLGTGSIVNQGKRAYRAAAKEGLKSQFKDGIRTFIKANIGSSAKESVTEGLTEFFQNIIDRHYLGKDEVGLFDNVKEAMAAGGFMGGVMQSSPSLAGAMTAPFTKSKNRNRVADNLAKISEIKNQLDNSEISETAKKILSEKLQVLENENKTIVTSEIANIDSMSKEDINELVSIDSDINNLRKDFSEIKNDNNLEADSKKEILSDLKSKAETLNQNKESIIDKYNETSKKEQTKESDSDTRDSDISVEEQTDLGENNEGGETITVNDSKFADFIPDTDPKIKKERERSKEKLKALRDKKNKKAEDIKEIKKEAVKYIKSILNTDDMKVIKKSEFNKIFEQLRDVDRSDKGTAKTPTDLNDILDNLENQVNKTRERKSKSLIDKYLKTKSVGKDKKAILPQEAIDVIDAYNQLTNDDISIDEINSLVSEGEFSDSFEEASELAELIKLAELEETSQADKSDIYEEVANRLSEVISDGKTRIKKLKDEDKDRRNENVEKAIFETSKKSREIAEIDALISTANKQSEQNKFFDSAKEVLSKINSLTNGEIADSFDVDNVEFAKNLKEAKKEFKNITDRFLNGTHNKKIYRKRNPLLNAVINGYLSVSADLSVFIETISKKRSDSVGMGFLSTVFNDKVRESNSEYLKLSETYRKKIQQQVINIYRENYSKFTFITGDVMGSVMKNLSKDIETDVFDSNNKPIVLSRGKLMWLYNQSKNPKNHIHIENANISIEKLNELVSTHLTEQDIKFADFVVSDLYKDLYSQVNDVYKKIYFRNMPKIENYAGQMIYEGEQSLAETSMFEADNNLGYSKKATAIFFGSGIDRVNNSKAISLEQDIMTNMFNYLDSANRFSSSAESYRDIKEILNDSKFTQNLKDFNHDGVKKQMEELVEYSFGFNAERTPAILNFFIGAQMTASLSLNPKLIPMQFASTTLWLAENPTQVAKNLFLPESNHISLLTEIWNNSADIRKRYKNISDVEKAYRKERGNLFGTTKVGRLSSKAKNLILDRLAFLNIAVGDAGGMFILGTSYYSMKKKEGLEKYKDEEKAIKYAIKAFNNHAKKHQQSYDSLDRDLTQHKTYGKLFNMYGNSPKQYHRNTIKSAIQIKRMFDNKVRGKKNVEYKGSLMENAWRIFLNHSLQGILYQWIGGGLVGLLSDDDEEQTKLKDLIWGATFGSFSKFFIIGDLAQASWDVYQERSYATDMTLPLLAPAQKFTKSVMDYQTASKKEDETSMEEASKEVYMRLLELSGVPAGKSEQLFKNWSAVVDGDYDSDEEMILRMLNYSQYQIDNMDEYHKKEADKSKKEKASATRKRRSKNKSKRKKSQFDKLK